MMQDTHSKQSIKEVLISGDLRIAGRFVWGSNYTFLAEVQTKDEILAAVYKPSSGERPLWDFNTGTLAAREVAAYLTSHTLGWGLVPPTVLRQDGPAGPGSLQLFVDASVDYHYFSFTKEEKERLRPLAVFDLVINNADRKGGHIIIGVDGQVWSIDHGVSFHIEDKLRTVVWDFATEIIPSKILEDLQKFHFSLEEDDVLRDEFLELISRTELNALKNRVHHLLSNPVFPQPSTQWSYPWPLV
jgi:uncharacterized repeat protein (TIGR03843 family)